MHPTIVINVVGLTPRMIGPDTPALQRLAAAGGGVRPLRSVVPAVTCPVQTTYLTGLLPREHGIVANGWYFRELAEVLFWRQSNRLVAGERIWEAARRRDPAFTCANMFWWYNMYATADIGVTPRPLYLADGRKIPDCYTAPRELRDELTARLGRFPLFSFWGPATSIVASEWIAQSALYVRRERKPTLTLIYLPHLDYVLQRAGPFAPQVPRDLREVDALCGEIIDDAGRDDARVIVLSEYGITPVSRPVDINRALRRAGLIAVREELGREQLDPGASAAFAVADHQIAHVYVAAKDRIAEVSALVAALPGVERVLDDTTKAEFGLDHPRSGELVALAHADSWFTYYYWLNDDKAPDYARTVDIHRKPGYDPVELFLDPAIRFPPLSVGWRLAKRTLGFRTLMDVIPLDATLVKGSHGRPTDDTADCPVLITSDAALLPPGQLAATDVKALILRHLFDDAATP
ncbi:MAG: nucleotide pyrophosphatase/phosphodiesterase family protein [Xanthobacteraceae bacterium]